MSQLTRQDRSGLRAAFARAARDVVVGDGDVREYEDAVQRARVTIWNKMGMGDKTARLEAARDRLTAARASLAESELRDLVLAMDGLFRAGGRDRASRVLDALWDEFGVRLVSTDYEGSVHLDAQFEIFARKFAESGFGIPTLTFGWNAETDAYLILDRRECSTGEEWRLEMSVPRSLFADEDALFERLAELTEAFGREAEASRRDADLSERERRRAEYLRLKAEFELDVGGES